MKKITNIILICIVAALTCVSCDKETPNYPANGQTGQLSLAKLTAEVVNAEVVVNDRSRAGEDLGNFVVAVTSASTSAVVQTWKYSEMPEIIALPVGDYTVSVVSSATEVEAGWETPYYKGSQNFTIKSGAITEVEAVKCTLQNLKVGIFYSPELEAALGTGDDVKVEVKVGDGSPLSFAYGETRAGFFKCSSENKTLVATFSGTVDGCFISEYKVLTDVQAGQYRKITFSLKSTPDVSDEYGTIGTTGMSLDATVTTVDLTVNVPGGEDIIEPDDFMNVSATELSYAAAGGSKELVISSSSAWTASSSDNSWCTVPSSSGQKGTSSIQVVAAANTASTARSAVVTVKSGTTVKTVTVSQAAAGTVVSNPPAITSSSINLAGDNKVVDGMTVDVDIVADAGIKNFVVDIISNDLTDDFLKSVGLTAHFDLCNPGQYEAGLNGLGLPTSGDVEGKQSLKFDISNFMPLLKIYKGTHKFKLTVTDANGDSAQETITLTVD